MTNKKPNRALTRRKKSAVAAAPSKRLINDLRQLIERSRQHVAQTVNSALVVLYWNVGRRIRNDILKRKRAEYGEQIVPSLSTQLVAEFGNGFGRRNLEQMVRFAEVFPDQQLAQRLSAQLSWSHVVELIPIEDSLQREFYAELCLGLAHDGKKSDGSNDRHLRLEDKRKARKEAE